ncbi:hypothetical protein SAMN02982929_02417 [Saccharopolyspora kobensis]|uniref:Uncharacterized protein n=1 Tax=Saccharopolyspora kobensis TaxID=146035 RepID=A0A1H6AQF1_9PSEU|nr:DUF6519 domain-containing protein [Saccharopolyspora kobensis]SEG50297.1 hypothetical protein SAMN02982929_02417 [Saccharopolyspora kobensis]SFE75802.1 hypothetical protein SAMN05216506_11425 [Saccharopolyspora kobensis]
MHADLSRITFHPERGYSAVIAQQGRVQVDADINEQVLNQLYQHRTALVDLIGQHGGPAASAGFKIERLAGRHGLDDLSIGPGRYYVGGVLCDAHRPEPGIPVPDEGEPAPPDPPGPWTYWDQPDAFRDPELPGDRLPAEAPYLVYLKVWERLVTAAEDPELREVALGADTSARIKVVWQVLALPSSELQVRNADAPIGAVEQSFDEWVRGRTENPARLAVRAQRPDGADEPCVLRPDARYRGLENQLYRVEIHDGGPAAEATFKWSRENGSVVFPVDDVDGTWVDLASLGGDTKLDLDVGDFVEFLDTALISRREPRPMLRVEELDLPERRVRLSAEPAVPHRPELHPFLRRWDHRGSRGGAVPVEEGRWIPVEDGVEIFFHRAESEYRSGDHWIVPARTATGDVEWPTDPAGRPLLRPPLGVVEHCAPLAWVTGEQVVDMRLTFGMT